MIGVCGLFVPASSPKMINKSMSTKVDTLIFDLEDAVSIDEKDSARELLLQALPLFKERNIAVRINGDTGCWEEDIEILRGGYVDTVIIPKARATHIKKVSAILDDMGVNTKIAVIIESADSLEELSDIAKSSIRLTSLLMGAEDYSLDLGVERTKEGYEVLYPRMKLANVAAAYHIEALDTPFADTKNIDGLRADAIFAKGLGFTGKLAIHPQQISTIEDIFYPTEKEIEWAKLVLEAVAAPENKGKGAFALQGKMIDLPIIKRAQKTLDRGSKK